VTPPKLPRRDLDLDGPLVIDLYGDLHLGSPAFDQARFLADLAETVAAPNRYLVLNGDLLDMSGKHQKHGGVFEQTMDPNKALDLLEEWLTPARDKILVITSGNHDDRGYAQAGLDPLAQLAARLKVGDRYLRNGGWVITRHGTNAEARHRKGGRIPVEYWGFVSHGTGMGPSSTSAERVCRSYHADWYALGHTHTPLTGAEDYFEPYPQTGSIVKHTKRWVVSGGYLDYAGYALEKRLVPRPIGRASVTLADGRKRVSVCLP
jgi:hypothetical protein